MRGRLRAPSAGLPRCGHVRGRCQSSSVSVPWFGSPHAVSGITQLGHSILKDDLDHATVSPRWLELYRFSCSSNVPIGGICSILLEPGTVWHQERRSWNLQGRVTSSPRAPFPRLATLESRRLPVHCPPKMGHEGRTDPPTNGREARGSCICRQRIRMQRLGKG